MTSETTTAGSMTSHDGPSTRMSGEVGQTPRVLGVGMAHRMRSQSVLGRHWSPSGLVGAVGRASIGFGLAVGRSQSIRPTVRFDDLNSAALRPSFDSWRHHRGSGDDVDDAVGTSEPIGDDRVSGVRGVMPSPTAAGRVPVERIRRHPQRAARPTWTDQIIRRSSVSVPSGPSSSAPVPASVSAVPADFVPSGDAKLDQLRLLVLKREQGDSPVTARQDPASPPGRTVEPAAAAVRAEQPVLRRTTAADPTVAAGTDGPGRLARAMRPESALAPSVPRARLGGSPTPTRSADEATDRAPARRSPLAARTAGRAQRTSQPTRLEQLRSILVEQGILSAGPDAADGGRSLERADTTSDDAGSTAPGDRPTVPRPVNTVADLQRAAATRVRRPSSDSPAPGGSATTPSASPDPPSDAAPRAQAQVTTLRTSSPTPTVGTPGSGSAAAGSERSAAAGAIALAERTTGATPSLPVTSRPAHELRAQRLLRSGLAPDTASADPATAIDPVARPGGVELVAEAVPTTTAIEMLQTSSVVNRAPAARSGSAIGAPTLTRADSSLSTVVRRVTLPRALSTAHRPTSHLIDAAQRDRSGQPAAFARASATSLAEAAIERSRTPASATVWSTRVAPAAVSTGPGTLLEAVRRLSTGDASAGSAHELPHAAHRRSDTEVSFGVVERHDPSARTAPTDAVAEVAGGVEAASPRDQQAQRPAERVAEQFMTVLSETVRRRPAPLPTTYRPLADAIAGPRPVMLSTDAASRKALRSVGKVAATTGDTIHLDRQAIPSVRIDEVMAHELTHVAHPSPTPRFFDDIDDSPEERRAEQVARVMARSPLAPSATTSAPPVRRRQDPRTIRRSPSPSTPSPSARVSSPGTVSAQALAASLTRTGESSDVVQRWTKATPSQQRPQLGSHRPAPTPAETSKPEPVAEPKDVFGTDRSVEWFRDQLEANLDRVVRLLEDRMIVELERRGGRAWRQS